MAMLFPIVGQHLVQLPNTWQQLERAVQHLATLGGTWNWISSYCQLLVCHCQLLPIIFPRCQELEIIVYVLYWITKYWQALPQLEQVLASISPIGIGVGNYCQSVGNNCKDLVSIDNYCQPRTYRG